MTWMFEKEFLERLDLDAYDTPAIAKRLELPLEMVMKFFDPKRPYRVESNLNYGWVAGTRDRRPTLVFVGRPRLAAENEAPLNAISFDAGKLVIAPLNVDDEDGLDDEEYVLGMLEDELGFEHVGHVNVPAFKYPNIWHYAVVPLAFSFHDIVVGTDDPDDEDLELARDWIRDGSYVLHCGNAYFMSSTGEVESS